jgi:exodeoxyribonuclease VII small subunit
MSQEINYTEAFEELQRIVSEIEQGEISVDELSEKVKRAAFLISICKTKLTTTEADVNKILKELGSTSIDTDEMPDNRAR